MVVNLGRREYWEMGLDAEGRHRLGAWQIKEIMDFSLPPRATTRERFAKELPAGTKSAEVEIRLTYQPSPANEMLIHRETRTVTF